MQRIVINNGYLNTKDTERMSYLKDLKEDNDRRSNDVHVVASSDEKIVHDYSVLENNALSFDRIYDA